MPASTINDVIELCATDIAILSYGGVKSLATQMGLWTTGLFGTSGIFPPSANATTDQDVVTNWYGTHLQALDAIEGSTPGSSGPVGTSACINAVFRVANAVKWAKTNNQISSTQQAAVVTLYNTVWE